MDQLMDKLIKSKAIMDRHDGMKRSNSISESSYSSMPMAQDFDIPQAKYNIPQEFLQEQQVQQPYLSQVPNTKPVGVPSVDAIKNSKLPDEIKKLMMEHPISQPQQPQMTLSSELIEKASRLMKEGNGNYVPESAKPKQQTSQSQPQVQSQGIDYKVIQKMINEAVRSALKENGLITESTEKTNEMFTFKVGKHQFEGRVTKVKKLS
jgi:hypothetical protein